MSKHTPGPWVAIRNNAFWEVVPQNKGPNDPYTIGDVCASDPDAPDRGLQEANARLIAAAPDLLEALKAAEVSIAAFMGAHGYPSEGCAGDVLAEARAAIAKAEGKDDARLY